MALRQFAVFMKAGSYVIRPKSSPPVLICRRSIARMVPSWIGSSHFLPVRLSTTDSVSVFACSARSTGWVSVVAIVRLLYGFAADAVRAVGPARQILDLAALA